MSFENQYSSTPPLDHVAALCEAVVSKEDWDNRPEDFDYMSMESVQVCEQLRKGFEAKYQVIQQLSALEIIHKNPGRLSYLILDRPRLVIPNSINDKTDHQLAITNKVKVAYSSVSVLETRFQDAPPYQGPHLAVILDTRRMDSAALAAIELKPGFYEGITPFRIARVPDDYTPHLMN